MRCLCCNAILTDYEATRRHAVTREFLDLCGDCFRTITKDAFIPYKDRPDLRGEYDTTDEDQEEVDTPESW